MPESSTHLTHFGPVDACPTCDERDFMTESQGDVVVFRCLMCGIGWRYELGFVWAVDSDPSDTDKADTETVGSLLGSR